MAISEVLLVEIAAARCWDWLAGAEEEAEPAATDFSQAQSQSNHWYQQQYSKRETCSQVSLLRGYCCSSEESVVVECDDRVGEKVPARAKRVRS